MTNISETRLEELIRECQKETAKSIQEGNPPFECAKQIASGREQENTK